jgi:hypothetical protein
MAPTVSRKTIPTRPAHAEHLGHRLSPSAGRLARWWHYHGLSIVLVSLFLASLIGQIWTGWYAYNEERQSHARPSVSLGAYLSTGHFGEATFENFESEFLQMAFYVLLTIYLYQVGSSESKRPDTIEIVDLDPRDSPQKDRAAWPVRKGGWVLRIYEHSLSLAFVLLFVLTFTLHAITGVKNYNEEQMEHGEPPATTMEYVASPQFWFESFQNWQSEFLSLATMVILSIFLRQRGSPESKPVDAPIWETAD